MLNIFFLSKFGFQLLHTHDSSNTDLNIIDPMRCNNGMYEYNLLKIPKKGKMAYAESNH